MLKNLTIAAALLFLAGCASHYGAAQIVTQPAGAEVINSEDGTVLGVTPLTVWWKEGSDNRQNKILRFKKDGYYEKVTAFWLSMQYGSVENAKANKQLFEVSLQKIGE
jgi:uncharacterized lipoprotein YajG